MGSLFGGGKQKSETKQKLPWWLESGSKQAVSKAQGIADRPYEGYTGDRIAGPTNNEQAGYLSASGFRDSYQPYLQQAGQSLAGADQRFTDADMAGYINPYVESALDPAARQMTERFEQQRNARNMNAAATGAYGGMRSVLANDRDEENYLQGIGDLYQQGMAGAYDRATNLWQSDRAQQQQLGDQYANLAGQSGALRNREISALLGAGQAERSINQADADFDFSQFLEERDWDVSNLQPLLAAVGSVPYAKQQTSTSGYDPSTGEKVGSALGAAATVASFFSSKKLKTDGQPIESGVLERISRMPVESWRYKGDNDRHIGPYAEDAQRELGIGDGTQIPIVDAIGTQYAGLQEAAKRIKALEDRA